MTKTQSFIDFTSDSIILAYNLTCKIRSMNRRKIRLYVHDNHHEYNNNASFNDISVVLYSSCSSRSYYIVLVILLVIEALLVLVVLAALVPLVSRFFSL